MSALPLSRIGRLWALFTKFSRPLVFGLSILLFSLSTVLHFAKRASLAEFLVGIITIVPLAAVTRFVTNDIVLKLQSKHYEFSAGLFNGILGNSAELCFAVTAVVRRESVIAQTALTGSLISNCLMIFGTCLLSGGILRHRQSYPVIIARTNAQLLVVSLVSIIIPTAFKNWSQDGETSPLAVSHGAAIVLLLEFASYIWFFYYTHTNLEDDGPIPSMKSGLLASGLLPALIPNPGIANDFQGSNEYRSLKELRDATQKPCSKEDKPRYPAYLDILILICSLVMLVFASIYVLEAIEAPSRSMNLSKSFVGLVVMPSIIASVDHIAATLRSHKEGIAWIIEIAFGSSVRISLFVFPIAVIVGWFLGVSDMNMILDGFQVIVLCLTIFLVNHVIHNGFLHWIEGTIFISSFLLFAIAIWHYPNNA